MSYSYLGMDPDTQTAHTGQSQSHGLLDTLEGTPARALTCSQPLPHGIGVESRYSMDSTITPTTHLISDQMPYDLWTENCTEVYNVFRYSP